MKRDRCLQALPFLIVLAVAQRLTLAGNPPPVPLPKPEPAAFHEFTQSVQQYVKIHQEVPRLRSTKHREEIVERRQALKQKIRETRPDAKPGDFFTPEVRAEFCRVIQTAFQGSNASDVRKTIRQGVPVPGWKLAVNGDYPEALPVTTVPPTLLLHLPQLPTGVAYRIIGHDFVLEDTEARLIVDFIDGVLP
jgi:hypothetical protein